MGDNVATGQSYPVTIFISFHFLPFHFMYFTHQLKHTPMQVFFNVSFCLLKESKIPQ
jgi:hypothetical protein